jgi:hypothetical protein
MDEMDQMLLSSIVAKGNGEMTAVMEKVIGENKVEEEKPDIITITKTIL